MDEVAIVVEGWKGYRQASVECACVKGYSTASRLKPTEQVALKVALNTQPHCDRFVVAHRPAGVDLGSIQACLVTPEYMAPPT